MNPHHVEQTWFDAERRKNLFEVAASHGNKQAIVADGKSFTYQDLLSDSARLSQAIVGDRKDMEQARLAFLFPAGYDYVVAQWAAWRSGAIAVPLCETHPAPELEYVLQDSKVSLVLCHPRFAPVLEPLANKNSIEFRVLEPRNPGSSDGAQDGLQAPAPPSVELTDSRGAMILYTSGTTGRPKGVVSTHGNIRAQVAALVGAWKWTNSDRILHPLPLHHIHGIINALTCALWAGAVVEFLPKFNGEDIWRRFMRPTDPFTLFMGVPTIYDKLISAYEKLKPEERTAATEAVAKLRLMVCGSAALPEPIMVRWRNISKHTLLERYGMSEMGMAISNLYEGKRIPGAVGFPLPGVQLRIVCEDGEGGEREAAEGEVGELRVKGPNVFKEYFNKPEETKKTFDSEGWFKTGDVAVCEEGVYRLLGRASADIIKTGGEKVSALEIERICLEHTNIAEIAVIGRPDPSWGERVAAIVVLRDPSAPLALKDFREWAKQRLAVYKVPQQLLVLDTIPRNAMGKVNKKDMAKIFEAKMADVQSM